jgi:hypothetical protein
MSLKLNQGVVILDKPLILKVGHFYRLTGGPGYIALLEDEVEIMRFPWGFKLPWEFKL